MARPSLADSWAKLRWARQHYDSLRQEIEPFEKPDAYKISMDIHSDVGEYVFYVHGLQPLNPDWGLRIGDCLHNARSALDYLTVQLVAAKTGQDPRDIPRVQFPVSDGPAAFSRFMKRFSAKSGDLLMPSHRTRFEELQPFNCMDPSIWGSTIRPAWLPDALDRLSELNNVDKHRLVHATWHSASMYGPRPAPVLPSGYKGVGTFTVSEGLENKTEIGRWRFELPLPATRWIPEEVDVKGYFPLAVTLTDTDLPQSVLKVLSVCLQAVDAVLVLFEPVFAHSGSPPLPVTAAPPLDV